MQTSPSNMSHDMQPRSPLPRNHQATMKNINTIIHTTHEPPHNPPDSLQAVQCRTQQARSRAPYPTSLFSATYRWPCSSQQHRSQRPKVRSRAMTNAAESRERAPPLRLHLFCVSRVQPRLSPAVCRRGVLQARPGVAPLCERESNFNPYFFRICSSVVNKRTKLEKKKSNGQNQKYIVCSLFLLSSSPPHQDHDRLPSCVYHVQYQE